MACCTSLLFGAGPSSLHDIFQGLVTPKVLFLHIAPQPLSELASTMYNHLSHIGFGKEHGFVTPTPRGATAPRVWPDNAASYVSVISQATSGYLGLDRLEESRFDAKLRNTVKRLTQYASYGSMNARRPRRTAKDSTVFDPIPCVDEDSPTNADFLMVLNRAAKRATDSWTGSGYNTQPAPVARFSESDQRGFRAWINRWIHSKSHPAICPPNSPLPTEWTLASNKRKADEMGVDDIFL